MAILLVFSVADGAAAAEPPLVLAVHPYLPHGQLEKKFTPLANYLAEQLGRKVDVRIGSDYAEHIQYAGNDKVDIAYMGPASYVNMVREFGDKPVLARLEVDGKPWFQGNIIARKGSGINDLTDLRGKRIAFGDPNSTMSYLVPHYMLHMAGVFSGTITKHRFLYSHSNVAIGVLSGDYDAGAVKPAVFEKYSEKGLKTVALTPKISEHLFVTRADMDPELVDSLRRILLDMRNSDTGLSALKAIKGSITGLVAAENSDYDNLRKIIIESETIHRH